MRHGSRCLRLGLPPLLPRSRRSPSRRAQGSSRTSAADSPPAACDARRSPSRPGRTAASGPPLLSMFRRRAFPMRGEIPRLRRSRPQSHPPFLQRPIATRPAYRRAHRRRQMVCRLLLRVASVRLRDAPARNARNPAAAQRDQSFVVLRFREKLPCVYRKPKPGVAVMESSRMGNNVMLPAEPGERSAACTET
jgi:hypothetical protein